MATVAFAYLFLRFSLRFGRILLYWFIFNTFLPTSQQKDETMQAKIRRPFTTLP